VVVFGSVEVSISLSHQCFLVSFLWHFFLTSIGRDRGSMVRCRGIWVDSSSIIGDISNIASIAISLVSNMLDTTIRKSNGIRSLSIASTITCFGSVEVGVGIVISYSIGVGVGGGHIRVSRGSMHNRGMVSWGSVDNRGMVSRSRMDNRSSMDNRGMVSWGSVVDRGSMVSRSMSKDSLCSMKTVRRVSNSSNSSSKSLGLCGAPVFSLVWPGY